MPFRTLLASLFAGLLLLLSPAAALAAPGPYPPPGDGGGSGSVSDGRVKAGECVIFRGTGFAPNTDVRITDNGRFVGTARTNGNGEFRYKVCFDVDTKTGRHTLRGTGRGSGGGLLTVSATVFVEGVSERPDGGNGNGSGNGGAGGDGGGGGLPRTGVASALLALTGVGLLGLGSAMLLASERRHRARRRATRLPA